MKKFTIIFCLFLLGYSGSAQNLEDLSFGSDTTFDILSWNIEWFPKNGNTTIDYVAQIITALDVDVLAIQEVDEISAFEQLIENLDGYEGYLESSWFAGLAYIYKTSTVQINDIYEIYTTNPYWSPFPRSPMVMDMNIGNERFLVINNHFKCCGDGILNINDPDDEETRRLYASNLLKEYIDSNFSSENVILLGDLNDNLSDIVQHNVFQMFIDDTEHYYFTDIDISNGDESEWSYPTWPSHLDHILITDELFDEFNEEGAIIQTIKIDEYFSGGWYAYDENVSDHRPVAMKLQMMPDLSISDNSLSSKYFINYPNPFNQHTSFTFNAYNSIRELKIFNTQGHKVFEEKILPGETSIRWNAEGHPSGIYYAKILLNNTRIVTLKLILL